MLQVGSRAGPPRQLPFLCQGPSVTAKTTVKAEALGLGLGPKPVSSPSVWAGVVREGRNLHQGSRPTPAPPQGRQKHEASAVPCTEG